MIRRKSAGGARLEENSSVMPRAERLSVASIRRLDKVTQRLSLRFNVSDWTCIEAVARNCRLPVGVVVVGLIETAIHRARLSHGTPSSTPTPVRTP